MKYFKTYDDDDDHAYSSAKSVQLGTNLVNHEVRRNLLELNGFGIGLSSNYEVRRNLIARKPGH